MAPAAAALIGVTALATPAAAAGTTRYVSTTGTDGTNTCAVETNPCASIVHAVAVAASGDTISVGAGTFPGEVVINKALTVSGAGQGATIIDGGASAGGTTPAVLVYDAVTPTADHVLDGVTVTGGKYAYGGGVLAYLGDTTVTNSTVTGNVGTFGGGVLAYASPVTVTNSTLSANTGQYGGGFGTVGAPITLTNTTVSGNTAWFGGGGLVISATTGTFSSATFSQNTAAYGGGGLFVAGSASVSGSTFDANAASTTNAAGLGGGIVLAPYSTNPDTPSITLASSTLSNNSAYSGGGLAVSSTASATLTSSNVTGNHAALLSGGIDLEGAGTADLSASNVAGNTALGGGGISVATGTLSASGGSITGNSAANAGALYVASGGTAGLSGTAISANTATAGNGGGIYNAGTTTVTDASIDNNVATKATTGSTGIGGGVFSVATTGLRIERSILRANTAPAAGALYATGPSLVDNATVTGNQGLGSVVSGGGLVLTNDTIAANPSGAGFGGVWSQAAGSPIAMAGTIVADPSGVGCANTPIDGGYNLAAAGDASCGFSESQHDLLADPALNALADNGGPTPSMLPTAASPAIDAIPAATATGLSGPDGVAISLCGSGATDQRGSARPQGAACDIGSVEAAVQAPTVSGPAEVRFVAGTASNVVYTTTGTPQPHLSETGALPAGVTFTDNGDGTATLAGDATTTAADPSSITVVATNGVGDDAVQAVSIRIVAPLAVTTTDLPGATDGTAYSATLAAAGGTAPYTWSLTGGSLPDGLTLSPEGVISGTPTGAGGTSTFTVTAADADSPAQTATATLSIATARAVTTLKAEPAVLKVQPLRLSVIWVKATLTRSPGNTRVAGQAVTFTAGSHPLCTATTDANGVAQCSVTLTLALNTVLGLGYDATFAGTPTLSPARAHASLIG